MKQMFVSLTVVSLRGRVPAVVRLPRLASLPVAAVLAVVAAVVVAGLGVFLQLLGQVGARRAGGNVVLVAVLRDLQLLDETHRPGRRRCDASVAAVFMHAHQATLQTPRVQGLTLKPQQLKLQIWNFAPVAFIFLSLFLSHV